MTKEDVLAIIIIGPIAILLYSVLVKALYRLLLM